MFGGMARVDLQKDILWHPCSQSSIISLVDNFKVKRGSILNMLTSFLQPNIISLLEEKVTCYMRKYTIFAEDDSTRT